MNTSNVPEDAPAEDWPRECSAGRIKMGPMSSTNMSYPDVYKYWCWFRGQVRGVEH